MIDEENIRVSATLKRSWNMSVGTTWRVSKEADKKFA